MVTKFENLPEDKFSFHLNGVKLYLTGSRFFNPSESKHSDIDLFTLNTPLTVAKLREYGFKALTKQELGYTDMNCASVFRYSAGKSSPDIDVQLVTDVSLKLACQNYIKNRSDLLSLFNKSAKSDRADLWNMVARIIKGEPKAEELLNEMLAF